MNGNGMPDFVAEGGRKTAHNSYIRLPGDNYSSQHVKACAQVGLSAIKGISLRFVNLACSSFGLSYLGQATAWKPMPR